MRSRLIWIILTGFALALLLLAAVQVIPSLSSDGDSADSDVNSSAVQPPDSGITPALFRNISEYRSATGQVVRLAGTSEPDSDLILLNRGRRSVQLRSDETGAWSVDLPVEGTEPMVLEMLLLVEDGLDIRGDETVFRIPVPEAEAEADTDADTEAATEAATDSSGEEGEPIAPAAPNPALIMVSAPGGPTRIVQSPFGGSPTNGPLSMGPIDYDDSGGVIFSGTTEEEGRVRLYAGRAAIGETRVGAGGRWNFIAGKMLPLGEYPITAELIKPDGTTVRVTVPFEFAPTRAEAGEDIPNPYIKFEPFRWQVRRALIGGGAQYTAIFAPDDAEALIVSEDSTERSE